MARPLRIEFDGALYHVTSRGDRREPIYEKPSDFEMFLSVLEEVCLGKNSVRSCIVHYGSDFKIGK